MCQEDRDRAVHGCSVKLVWVLNKEGVNVRETEQGRGWLLPGQSHPSGHRCQSHLWTVLLGSSCKRFSCLQVITLGVWLQLVTPF